MTEGGVRVVLSPPAGWQPAPVGPPDLSQTPQVAVVDWRAWGPAEGTDGGGGGRLVAACLGGGTRWWTPEAEPLVLDRLGAVVSSTAVRVTKVGERRVAATRRDDLSTSQVLEGAGGAEGKLAARTFLGFVDGAGDARLVGCFALCTTDLGACGPSVRDARVDARFVPAPRPTLTVRAIVGMAHHPTATAASAFAVALFGVAVALATRRRPRTK